MKTFGWDLCHSCNYACPYCGVWKDHPERDLILSPSEWEKVWDRIHGSYGRCMIFVSGGEPSVYPGFFEIVRLLAKNHLPDICTNLSWDVRELIPHLKPGELRISATFHPSFADFEEFFEKALAAREYLADGQVYYVVHPSQIEEMPERSRRLREKGIKLVPLPLRGDGFTLNSEREKKIIEEISPYKGSDKIDYQLQKISPKGRLCRAGTDYAVIRYDGKVDRCSQYADGSVGAINDPGFKLGEIPVPCGKDYCPIESQWIVSEKIYK